MSNIKQDAYIWIDEQFIPWQQANVHCLSHTLHYGMGVFEGIRAYNTEQGAAIFRLQDHITRLFNSAHIVGIQMPFNRESLIKACADTLLKNNLRSAYLRPMVYRGSEYLGLHAKNLSTHVMIAVWEWGAYLGAENLIKGIRVHTSSFTRNHVNSVLSKAKANGNYMNSVLAVNEAHNNGYDEALLLDANGYVAEGSGENIFIIRKGTLYTPTTASVLEGITRETIITLANDMGLTVKEKNITRDEVYLADEAFFTGTAAEVTPIRELDGRSIGSGSRGIITEKLQKLYDDVVHGKKEQYTEWLTYI